MVIAPIIILMTLIVRKWDFRKCNKSISLTISGILDKKKGLFAKRRMFLLTEGPHLYYVDPSAMVLKGEIPWSGELETEIRDFRIFFVKVPDVTSRVYYLIDPDSTAKDWCLAIEELRDFYYGRKASQQTDAETLVSSTTSN